MSTVTANVVHSCDAAYVLQTELGPVVAWMYWLVDVRRGIGAEFGCHPLLPVCSLQDQKGYWRPAYRASDLRAFIAEFKEKNPELISARLKPIRVELDPADLRSWKARKIMSSIKTPKAILHRSMLSSRTRVAGTVRL